MRFVRGIVIASVFFLTRDGLYDEITALQEAVCRRVHRGGLVHHLCHLGKCPFVVHLATATRKERFAARRGKLGQIRGITVRRMVLPQKRKCKRRFFKSGGKAKRNTRFVHRDQRAAGKINTNTHHLVGANARSFHRLGDHKAKRFQIVGGVLQRVVGGQFLSRGAKHPVHHAVGIIHRHAGKLATVGGIQQKRTRRKRAKIHTDRIFCHILTPFLYL